MEYLPKTEMILCLSVLVVFSSSSDSWLCNVSLLYLQNLCFKLIDDTQLSLY